MSEYIKSTRWTAVRTQSVIVQGNNYTVESGISANGTLEGYREVLRVNGDGPELLSSQEHEAILQRI